MTTFASRAAAFLLLGLALSGCESAADRTMKNSPDYKAGYSDGCASAAGPGANMRDTGRVRDDQAYQGNRAYGAGWDTGFHACGVSRSSGGMPPMPGQGPIPDPTAHPF
jgi:hypothetical protein